jgi:hypothetical protein
MSSFTRVSRPKRPRSCSLNILSTRSVNTPLRSSRWRLNSVLALPQDHAFEGVNKKCSHIRICILNNVSDKMITTRCKKSTNTNNMCRTRHEDQYSASSLIPWPTQTAVPIGIRSPSAFPVLHILTRALVTLLRCSHRAASWFRSSML